MDEATLEALYKMMGMAWPPESDEARIFLFAANALGVLAVNVGRLATALENSKPDPAGEKMVEAFAAAFPPAAVAA